MNALYLLLATFFAEKAVLGCLWVQNGYTGLGSPPGKFASPATEFAYISAESGYFNYDEAKDACKQVGKKLATIKTAEDNAKIQAILAKIPDPTELTAVIGLRYGDTGAWVWEDDPEIPIGFEAWQENFPFELDGWTQGVFQENSGWVNGDPSEIAATGVMCQSH